MFSVLRFLRTVASYSRFIWFALPGGFLWLRMKLPPVARRWILYLILFTAGFSTAAVAFKVNPFNWQCAPPVHGDTHQDSGRAEPWPTRPGFGGF